MYKAPRKYSDRFKDCILILPSVSVGNVGQLAVDLLISTLDLKKIGHVRHPNIQPIIGYNEENNSVATEIEIFGSEHTDVFVIQIRSTYGPFVSVESFLNKIATDFKLVVILCGSYAYERKCINLVNDTIRFQKTDAFKESLAGPLPTVWKEIKSEALKSAIQLPGSGIGDHLFNWFASNKVPALIIVNYISEGDNRDDAVKMVNYIDSWLKMRKSLDKSENSWRIPSSWSSFYGNTFPPDMF